MDHWVDTITPWEKKTKKKTNKHASVICLLAKKCKIPHFIFFYNKVLWYAESDGVIFVKIVWLLGGISPYFLKWGKFSQARNFWRVRLILMKFIYLKSALKCDSFDVTTGIKIPFFRVLVTNELGRSLLQFVTTDCLKQVSKRFSAITLEVCNVR